MVKCLPLHMTKEEQIANFDPNGVGLRNGHFIGLPFTEKTASVVFLSVPWDVTVSYGHGTAGAPANILESSTQLDLYDPAIPDAWKIGLYLKPPDPEILKLNNSLRGKAELLIEELEFGDTVEDSPHLDDLQKEINQTCEYLRNWVYRESSALLDAGKLVGILGGDHSVPLGYLQALGERHEAFGVLQIDAHCDLRPAYEGFVYSHASIFYNALAIPQMTQLVQVGIRDCCEQEVQLTADSDGRIQIFFEEQLRQEQFAGRKWAEQVEEIIATLPPLVYISFDIDGLDPKLCPNTGTPVPGGLELSEAFYLLKRVVESGRRIIGFDLCEVGGRGNEWDGNVGARILYRLGNLLSMCGLVD